MSDSHWYLGDVVLPVDLPDEVFELDIHSGRDGLGIRMVRGRQRPVAEQSS